MEQHSKITQRHPSTGAQPSEQTAENAKKGVQQDHVWRIDEMLYKLVENNVAYAGEQFGENLRFNSETLTNVLYDNIKKLLGEKFDSEEFATQVADQLLENGYVLRQTTPETTNEQPKEEIVYAIDEKDYQELLDKINAALVLLETNKDTIAKRIAAVDGQVRELGNTIDTETELKVRKDQEIKELVERIKSNQGNVETYIESHEQVKREFAEKVLGLERKIDEFEKVQGERRIQDGKLAIKTMDILDRAGRNWQRQQDQSKNLQDKLGQLGKSRLSPERAPTTATSAPIAESRKPAPKTKGAAKLGKSLYPGVRGKRKSKGLLGPRKKDNSLVGRVKRRIGVKARQLKNKISRSAIGKTYRAIAKTVKFVVKMVKGVAKAVIKTAVAAWKATKFVAKTFYKASKFTGKLVRGAVKATITGVKKLANLAKKGPKAVVVAVLSINPGKMIGKLGWRAIKFVGKSIWKGIKALAFKAISFFGGLFGLVGKFVNKIGYWVGVLADGIIDKTYKFIIKPLASMMVSIFNFVSLVVMSPIQFIKWLVPSVMDRFLGALSNISQAVKGVLKSTWGIFRRILFNPITITLLVGGLFFLLWKWLSPKLSGGIQGIKDSILPPLKSIASYALKFLSGAWTAITTIGKYLYTAIEWITRPKGPIAKFVKFVATLFLAFKSGLKKLMKATGRSNIDILCMFLAGDTIGLALHAVVGCLKGLWDWFKKTKFMRMLIGLIKMYLAVGKLIFNMYTIVGRSLLAGMWQVAKGNFGGVIEAVIKPWKDLWQQIKDLFSGKPFTDEVSKEAVWERSTEQTEEEANETSIAVRSLKMTGKGKAEDNIAYFNKLQDFYYKDKQYGDLLPRIERMNDFYQKNAKQVSSYDDFLTKTWEMGKAGADTAQQVMKAMLESPEISQKLLSVFFYYNPQTGDTEMLRPQAYIGQFIDNIRKMVSDPNRDDSEAFKMLVEAFDQLNQERSNIVSNQAAVIGEFSEKMANFDKSRADNEDDYIVEEEVLEFIDKFNKGDLFSAASGRRSFTQLANTGDAITRNVEGVTGSTLGNNELLKVKPLERNDNGDVAVKDSEFVLKEEEKGGEQSSRDKIGNIVLPPGSNPAPVADSVPNEDMYDLWEKHQKKRRDYINAGHNDEDADKAGLMDMTFDEFKRNYQKLHPKSPEQLAKEEENLQKRTAALRNAKMISAYHNQGKVASQEGFKFTGTPSILQIQTDGLGKTLYMFSPEWRKYNNAVVLNDDEILLAINKDDKAAQERIRKRQEAEKAKKAEEERQRRREQQILDYSAKVSGGFIEVKIGEDEDAMREAWYVHQRKRREFINAGNNGADADKAGLIDYSWEEWKRYYRKMHGLPEDGIKRIPFEGKRKERQIDWNARYPLSVEELGQYGIEVSENGPVMIPLDKAMKAAGSLLANAKTIYSVRDGLEVMRQGLKTETNKLKEQRKEGQPVAVAQVGGSGEGGDSTDPQPPDQSTYSDVGW